MNPRVLDELKKQLRIRGFAPDGTAPQGTLALDDEYLLRVELGEFFDTMVARREKVFRSTETVGADAARRSYDDVVLVIDAIKSVLLKVELP